MNDQGLFGTPKKPILVVWTFSSLGVVKLNIENWDHWIKKKKERKSKKVKLVKNILWEQEG